jgi:signal transduction histidine kinase
MSRLTSNNQRVTGVRNTDELQRFVNLGKMSASLLHEISSPLTAALITIDQISDQTGNINSIKRSLLHLTSYVDAAKQQLRNESSNQCFYIDQQFKTIGYIVNPIAIRSEVKLVIRRQPHIKLGGDPIKFQQIVVNLIINAIEAYENVDIRSKKIVTVQTDFNSRYITITISDNGVGISREQLNYLFDRFYTTKSAKSKGLGLGLALVRHNVEHHFMGNIRAVSGPIIGTKFIVKMPSHKVK